MTQSLSSDYLVSHAYKHVWSAHYGDKQTIYQLARLTPNGGVYGIANIYWHDIELPNPADNFHIYQIGQVHPSLLNLSTTAFTQWVKATDTTINHDILIEFYTNDGLIIPRQNCYYRMSSERNLVVAILYLNKDNYPIDLDKDTVSMRIYANPQYANYKDDNGALKAISLNGIRVQSRQDVILEQNKLVAVKSKYSRGELVVTTNGYYSDNFNPITTHPSDYLDWVFDATIYQHIDFKIDTLPSYQSTLDNESKYLISHNEKTDYVEYYEDVDYYLISKVNNTVKGVLISKDDVKNVRQVTHRDYGISKDYIQKLLERHTEIFQDINKVYIRLIYHKPAVQKHLIHEANKLYELYKLPYRERIKVMTVLNDKIPDWHASNLEQSAYIKIMTDVNGKITNELVQEAYGYTAITKLIADTPTKPYTNQGIKVANVPLGLQSTCTAYEYDSSGYLIHVQPIENQYLYTVQNSRCDLVEFIYGKGSNTLDIQISKTKLAYHDTANYRFYLEESPNTYKDITDTNHYTAEYNIITPKDNTKNLLALSTRNHLYYEFKHRITDAYVHFNIQYYVDNKAKPLPIPLSDVDVFLNGKALVENVDYFIKWPTVIITNKEFLNTKDYKENTIAIRAYGYCNPDMTRNTHFDDIGFLYGALLSNNNKYDIRDDKVISITINGQRYAREELTFAEGYTGAYVSDSRNGTPYSIKDISIPIHNYLIGQHKPEDKSTLLKTKSDNLEKRIVTYLNQLYQTSTTIDHVDKTYNVYSPFLSKIIYDLNTNYLSDNRIQKGNYSDSDVKSIVSYYTNLLEYDPISSTNPHIAKFAIIDATCFSTPLRITLPQRRFLQRVIDLYKNDKTINLDDFITVS